MITWGSGMLQLKNDSEQHTLLTADINKAYNFTVITALSLGTGKPVTLFTFVLHARLLWIWKQHYSHSICDPQNMATFTITTILFAWEVIWQRDNISSWLFGRMTINKQTFQSHIRNSVWWSFVNLSTGHNTVYCSGRYELGDGRKWFYLVTGETVKQI
jgi:hypothetical protein